MRDRLRFEDAIERILGAIKMNVPETVNKVADKSGVKWATTRKVIDLVEDIQDFLAAYEIHVIKTPRRKLILLRMRVEMTKLPSDVIDWFLESPYFTTPKAEYSTEAVRNLIVKTKKARTPFHEAVVRVVRALELEDQISILELSKRCDLNRRTVDRALSLLDRYQSTLADTCLVEMNGTITKEPVPTLYLLDNPRMIYLLKRRYVPQKATYIPKERERELLSLP